MTHLEHAFSGILSQTLQWLAFAPAIFLCPRAGLARAGEASTHEYADFQRILRIAPMYLSPKWTELSKRVDR
jgi:hypothetical protein